MQLTLPIAIATVLLQAQADPVLYVYRDLLKPNVDSPAGYDERCGTGTGPFKPLIRGAPGASPDIAKQIDQAGVPALIDRALRRVVAALPGPDVIICAFAGQHIGGLPYLGGVGGVSLGGGRIKLFLHPAPGRLDRVEYTVAHEYHHEAERLLGPQPRFGPLRTVIREGKADNFAVMLYPDLRPPHTQPLSDDELRAAWRQLMDYEKDPSGFGAGFMIGQFPNGTRWPGYRLGYEMVEAYVRSVRQEPREWIEVDARVVLEQFKRTPRFKALLADTSSPNRVP